MLDPNRLERTHVVNVQMRDKNRFVVILSSPPLIANGHHVRDREIFEVSWDQWVSAKAKAEDLR